MKLLKVMLGTVLMSLSVASFAQNAAMVDSVYLFSYSTAKNSNHNGLHFAWSADKSAWHEIGPEYAFVKSDYGNWGPQKRMFNPSLKWNGSLWEVIFSVTQKGDVTAHCTSPDLIHYKPQDYYGKSQSEYFVNDKVDVLLPSNGMTSGEVHRVPWLTVEKLIDEAQRANRQNIADEERAIDDATRWPDLKDVKTQVVLTGDEKEISDKLVGIFFEDINYAADGGLYAELVQNRDFEYSERDSRFRDKNWTSLKSWTVDKASVKIDTINPITYNNRHYAVVDAEAGGSLINEGWDGIVVKAGQKYDVSMYGRSDNGATKVSVAVVGRDKQVLGQTTLSIGKGRKWNKASSVIKVAADCDSASLVLTFVKSGVYDVDFVSLFPQNTFKNRKNGLRQDLAQALADLKPKFVRFPGGCVAHGDGLDNMYRWKNTIGPIENRVPNWNIWRYHQTVGLGYYEYFLLCEDIEAEPLPVLAAGVPCQNSCVGGLGQQGGVPMQDMDEYIQDVLDLIEWANGDPKTSKWAKMRAEAGHPKPFGLKYVGIGNEDLISDVFIERFSMIYNAVRTKYPEIQVVGTVGPSSEGSDYEAGWELARQLDIPLVDEHYYRSPGWFVNHQDFYDRYQRGGTKVYLGEYAAHIPGRANCLETALAEALYLCNVERNGDVVEMTSYAPLFSKRAHTQWTPDMIYFGNTYVRLSTGYQVQRMFGNNSGQRYLSSTTSVNRMEIQKRVVSSVVKDELTGETIVKFVNMLPVENEVEVKLREPLTMVASQILTGELKDQTLVPSDFDSVTIEGDKVKFKTPAYSFVVVRLK